MHPYYKCVGIYPGGEWSWTYASNGANPLEIQSERMARIAPHTHIYNEAVHLGAFAIPNHIRKVIAQ